MVNCETQEEVDGYWKKLTAGGGKEVECGWLNWAVLANRPYHAGELMGDKDKEKAKRVMQAMLKMKKIEIEGLKRAAYES